MGLLGQYIGQISNYLFSGKNKYKMFFVPNSNQILGKNQALWVDVDAPYDLFNTIPMLNSVIRKKALMFANMELKLVDVKTNEPIDDSEFYRLIQNPNPTQSMNVWLRNFKEQEQVYGNQFIYKNKPSRLTKYPSSLQNVSPKYLKVNLTGKYFDQVTMEGIVKNYELVNMPQEKPFDVKDILWTRISDLDNPLVGVSPIKSLKFPVSNSKAAYEYLNVISTEKGAIGILSNQTKDAVGALPLDPDERKEIEQQYGKDYGLSEDQRKIILTNASLAWTPMSYPTKDLLLLEQIDKYDLAIIDHFGLNANIFSSKSATYENVVNSLKLCYQDTIIPEADEFAQSLTSFLGVDKTKAKIIASYDHIPVLSKDLNSQISTIDMLVNSLTNMIQANLITVPQAVAMLNDKLANIGIVI